MIPSVILFGLAFGRWWRTALIVAALAWPVTLVATDVMGLELTLLGASLLAVANAGVGVLAHRAVLFGVRTARAAQ